MHHDEAAVCLMLSAGGICSVAAQRVAHQESLSGARNDVIVLAGRSDDDLGKKGTC